MLCIKSVCLNILQWLQGKCPYSVGRKPDGQVDANAYLRK